MLKTVELAFLEALLLSNKTPQSVLLYLIKRKLIAPNTSLLDLAIQCKLTNKSEGQKIIKSAEQAVAAAGTNAFSFSKGALIGPWEIGETRGIGIGGSHFIAKHEARDQTCLLRLIEPGLTEDKERLQRLDDRANSGAEPPHPSILKIDETGEDFGWLYTVTYNTDGWNLSSRLAQGPLLESEAIPLMRTVAEALRVAHGFQVVHGGLSPLGMLMNQDGNIFLTDFGVGAVHIDGPLTGQRPGTRLGTMLYTAPELLWGSSADGIDPRSDIYALGSVIFDCILRPDAHPNPDPNVPWAVDPAASPNFKTVLARCMHSSPAARYPNIEMLIADLDLVITGRPPNPMAPGVPTAPFLAPRATTAVPQVVLSKKVLESGESSDESAEELRQRNAVGEDFLAAIAAGAPPPEVPDGYQEELFAPADEAPAPVKAPPPPKTTVKTQSTQTKKRDTGRRKAERKSSGRNKSVSKRNSRKLGTSSEASQKTVSSRTKAPTKRERGTAKKSASNLSIFVLFTIIATIGGGVFGARKVSELPPNEQIQRLQTRAEYLSRPGVRKFSQAVERINLALELIKNSPTPIEDADKKLAQLRELRFITRQNAVVQYRLEREQLLATPAAEKEQALNDALLRYQDTPAGTLLKLDKSLASGGSFTDLTALGEELFKQGLAADAKRTFEKALEAKTNFVVKKWLSIATLAAQDMVFVPEGRIVGPNKNVIVVPAFYIDKAESTRGQYNDFLEDLKKRAKEGKAVDPNEHLPPNWKFDPNTANLPVTNVTFLNAQAYLKWLGKEIPNSNQFTLACKGPGQHPFPWGNSAPTLYRACVAPFFTDLTPVASFPAGSTLTKIYDLIGNASEWCDQEGDEKLALGGSYLNTEKDSETLINGSKHPIDDRKPQLGFRGILPAELPQS